MQRRTSIPAGLVEDILAGRCVAFVGAGFSAARVKAWPALLESIADSLGLWHEGSPVRSLLDNDRPAALNLEAAAQLLQDEYPKAFRDALRREVSPDIDSVLERRRRLLLQIPFSAIVTTNFDTVLNGDVAAAPVYRRVLRRQPTRWSDEQFWKKGGDSEHVVKLHGDAGDHAVLARRDYRRHLYEDARYASFVRSLMATRTVLYLGVSFTDAYINELRSEVLALLGHEPGDEPTAYAIANDVSEPLCDFFARHEGIRVINYDSETEPAHRGFDELLSELHGLTNTRAQLRQLLRGKRILWVDPEPDNNDHGMKVLTEGGGERPDITQMRSHDHALATLRDANQPRPDLVVSNWGHVDGRQESLAQSFMRALRKDGVEVPVVVFCSPEEPYFTANRAAALRLGAFDACGRWPALFEALRRLVGRPDPAPRHRRKSESNGDEGLAADLMVDPDLGEESEFDLNFDMEGNLIPNQGAERYQ